MSGPRIAGRKSLCLATPEPWKADRLRLHFVRECRANRRFETWHHRFSRLSQHVVLAMAVNSLSGIAQCLGRGERCKDMQSSGCFRILL